MRSFIPQLVDRWFRTQDVFGPDSAIASAPGRGRNAIAPTTWFVDAQLGFDGHSGTDPRKPKKLLTPLIGNGSSSKAHSGDTIYVVGNITEEITAYNLLEDISIIGIGNRPRHADRARDYASYAFATNPQDEISGVSWRQASSHGVTTDLLTIRAQGWHLENILFVPPSDAAAIGLSRNALSDVSEYDASHLTLVNCRFAGGQDGIRDTGGHFNVHIKECSFHDQTGNGILTVNTAVAVPLAWVVEDCRFWGNANHIRVSANHWVVRRNSFGYFTNFSVSLAHVSAQGERNQVYMNYFSGDYDGEYLGGANDEWAGNMSMDTASGEVGAEGWTTAAPVA